ncbi:1-phosphatidylinositol phosphodiesterase isoform X3 [Siniperca chuatsi]|uniref:1-phosphatidylinositol phosphodiesterase isoform X3 n=1 Tax=Siniperca chuatsi TaxID=119488 RepID=UPI001CE1A503|nr:1-phosphatidylinositol phosphodiesterase isoform X3 [Siniperca chuatsi]
MRMARGSSTWDKTISSEHPDRTEDRHLLVSGMNRSGHQYISRTDRSDMRSGIRGGPVKMQKMLIELMVLAGVLGLSHGAIQRPDYDDTPNPEFLNPSWMASIPDDQLLSEVTMPGTHNTMALYGGVYAECQTWSLASQLRAGIRFLDVRVRHVNGNLTIHHGVSYQRAHFGQVLEDVADFLREHPSETVLMRVKEEFSETYDIYGAVVDFIHRYAHWDLLWHSRLVPTMGEARGKHIVLQDFSGPDLGMRYGSLDIADDWKVPTLLHVEEKWQSVYEHLEAAPAGNKAQIFLTYSSGAGVFAYPRAVAQRINAQLYDYLRAKTDLNQRLGIICMDFPAAPIIQMIIDFQLKEVRKRRQAFNPVSSKASLKYTISSLRKKMIKRFAVNV